MSWLDPYRKKLAAQISEHKAQLYQLKAQARRVAVQSRIAGYKELARAEEQLQQVKARFKGLQGASGSAFGEIRTGIKQALAELQASTKKATTRFRDHAHAQAKSVRAKAKVAPSKPKGRPRTAKSSRLAKIRK